jgi:hypothetical protein
MPHTRRDVLRLVGAAVSSALNAAMGSAVATAEPGCQRARRRFSRGIHLGRPRRRSNHVVNRPAARRRAAQRPAVSGRADTT